MNIQLAARVLLKSSPAQIHHSQIGVKTININIRFRMETFTKHF